MSTETGVSPWDFAHSGKKQSHSLPHEGAHRRNLLNPLHVLNHLAARIQTEQVIRASQREEELQIAQEKQSLDKEITLRNKLMSTRASAYDLVPTTITEEPDAMMVRRARDSRDWLGYYMNVAADSGGALPISQVVSHLQENIRTLATSPELARIESQPIPNEPQKREEIIVFPAIRKHKLYEKKRSATS